MIVDEQRWTLSIDGVDHEVIDGNVTIDDSWAPFIQGTATIATPADRSTVDPRTLRYLDIRMTQKFGDYALTSDLSARFGGMTTADVTAAWCPGTTSDLSDLPGRAWNPVFREGSSLDLLGLVLRGRRINTDGTTEIRFSSAESLMQDTVFPAIYFGFLIDDLLGPWQIRRLLRELVEIDLRHDPADILVPAGVDPNLADVFVPGTNLWTWFSGRATAANLRLWVDTEGKLRLTEPNVPLAGDLDLSDFVTDLPDDVDRDSDTFADGVLVEYAPNLSSPTNQLFERAGIQPGFADGRKTTYVRLDVESPIDGVNNPVPSVPSVILGRQEARGRTIPITALSNYNTLPNRTVSVDVAGRTDLPVFSGLVDAVTFTMPAAEMTVTTREIDEV